jgi:hypothetical protein
MSLAEQRRLKKAFFAPEEPTFGVFLNLVCDGCGDGCMHTTLWHFVPEDVLLCRSCHAMPSTRNKTYYEEVTGHDPYFVPHAFVQMTATQFAAHKVLCAARNRRAMYQVDTSKRRV